MPQFFLLPVFTTLCNSHSRMYLETASNKCVWQSVEISVRLGFRWLCFLLVDLPALSLALLKPAATLWKLMGAPHDKRQRQASMLSHLGTEALNSAQSAQPPASGEYLDDITPAWTFRWLHPCRHPESEDPGKPCPFLVHTKCEILGVADPKLPSSAVICCTTYN